MKALDRVLQRWRMTIVRPYVFSGARVLDVGCADGTLFKYLGSKVGEAVGVDPGLNQSVTTHRCRLIAGRAHTSRRTAPMGVRLRESVEERGASCHHGSFADRRFNTGVAEECSLDRRHVA